MEAARTKTRTFYSHTTCKCWLLTWLIRFYFPILFNITESGKILLDYRYILFVFLRYWLLKNTRACKTVFCMQAMIRSLDKHECDMCILHGKKITYVSFFHNAMIFKNCVYSKNIVKEMIYYVIVSLDLCVFHVFWEYSMYIPTKCANKNQCITFTFGKE